MVEITKTVDKKENVFHVKVMLHKRKSFIPCVIKAKKWMILGFSAILVATKCFSLKENVSL